VEHRSVVAKYTRTSSWKLHTWATGESGGPRRASTYQCNCLTPQILAHYGLSLNNAAGLALLPAQVGSQQTIAAGFGLAYPGMPLTNTVAQQIRPVPQWASGGPSSFLGP
jgi:hypothetical protein